MPDWVLIRVPRQPLERPSGLPDTLGEASDITDSNDAPAPSETERILHSLGNHLTLIETHTDHIRRQLALLAVAIEARD